MLEHCFHIFCSKWAKYFVPGDYLKAWVSSSLIYPSMVHGSHALNTSLRLDPVLTMSVVNISEPWNIREGPINFCLTWALEFPFWLLALPFTGVFHWVSLTLRNDLWFCGSQSSSATQILRKCERLVSVLMPVPLKCKEAWRFVNFSSQKALVSLLLCYHCSFNAMNTET